MALINCPECGKQISTSAKVCPHCGCEVTVCPDCNAVFTQKPKVCPKCGHAFIQPVNQDAEKFNFINNIVKILNLFMKVMYLLEFIEGILFLILIFKFQTFTYSSIEAQLNEFTSTYNFLHALTISTFVIYAFLSIISPFSFFRYPTIIILKIILNVKNIDGKQCCKNYLTTANKPVLNDYKLLLFATFLQSNKTEENLYYVRVILAAVLTVVSSVCCGIFVMNIIDSHFYCLFWETENNFFTTFSSYIPLIICGVAVIGKIIIEFSNNTYSKILKWCKDNSLPYDFNMK